MRFIILDDTTDFSNWADKDHSERFGNIWVAHFDKLEELLEVISKITTDGYYPALYKSEDEADTWVIEY